MPERTIPFQAGHSKKSARTERRAYVRMPSGQEVCCQPIAALTTDEPETAWSGTARDVSLGGIALILTRRFEPGTVLIVELSTKGDEGSRHLPVRVIHAAQEKKGHWIIGCAFVSMLSEEELQALLRE